ncbi:hypothetical protein V6N11_069087 [Hibiscus sabdariffa]|uniref:RNase H type-1 domain-containing protein n=1 Tax=Hibiscus sabdariffa TaxID=183260 RepID=A0ABR2A5T5_9ROSI
MRHSFGRKLLIIFTHYLQLMCNTMGVSLLRVGFPPCRTRGVTFANVISVDGNWDTSQLAALFDESTIAHTCGIKCPSCDDGVDRSFLSLSNGTIGGLFRNSNGDWFMGFAKAVGHSNSLQAELLTLFEGLSLAWEQGFRKHLVRSDIKQVVDLVNSPSAVSST